MVAVGRDVPGEGVHLEAGLRSSCFGGAVTPKQEVVTACLLQILGWWVLQRSGYYGCSCMCSFGGVVLVHVAVQICCDLLRARRLEFFWTAVPCKVLVDDDDGTAVVLCKACRAAFVIASLSMKKTYKDFGWLLSRQNTQQNESVGVLQQ